MKGNLAASKQAKCPGCEGEECCQPLLQDTADCRQGTICVLLGNLNEVPVMDRQTQDGKLA